jgi:methylenetetrahydrofolate dehydrogenase (NADP+)/methenyltetrahydrofolate cyclohydrolase
MDMTVENLFINKGAYMGTIIDGKLVSKIIKERVADEVKQLKAKKIYPCLAVILVGDDPASQVYVKNKQKACEETGIISRQFNLPADTGQEKLVELIYTLNIDERINGILVQLPLPRGYDEKAVLEAESPYKDVDAFHPKNVGKIMIGEYDFLPCTPAGIMELLDYYNIDVVGKECAVVGRSNIVGKPMSMLLLHKDGTVTTAHSKTKNLADICKRADILVTAVGKPGFITADMVKDGAVVIDVGINRVDGKLCGDVDFENVKEVTSAITPVPGGVGPMTIAMLMQNTITATKKQFQF